jgi:hypothetical protein
MLMLGLIGGVAMMMRAQEALWLLLPGGECAWHVVRGPERRRWLGAGMVLVAATLVAFSPQMLVWWYYTGSPFQPAQVEPLRLDTPFFVVALFSTRGGLFSWSPICYAALVGLFFCRRARLVTLALVFVYALEIYVVASAWMPTAGYAFGARRLSDGAVVFALGVALLWARLEAMRVRWPRYVVGGFVGFCVVLNVWAMELLRAKKIASSGGNARTAEKFLSDAGAPAPVARFFGRVGYPFVQPAGWLFALAHHAPASAFEGVVGNFILDRDGQWMHVQQGALVFDDMARSNVVSGLSIRSPKGPADVVGEVRLLLFMFAKEPIVVHVIGTVPPGARSGRWNGVEVAMREEPRGLRLSVPVEAMRAGTNEVELKLPGGAVLSRLEFESTTEWWRKKR